MFLWFLVFSHFSKSTFVVTSTFFPHKSETTFSKQFSLKVFVCFFILNSRMSRNMCKMRHKVRNSQNIPPLNQIWQIIQTINAIFTQIWDHIIITFFSKHFFLFSTQSYKMSLNVCKLCHKLHNAKTWVAIRLTWQNEP